MNEPSEENSAFVLSRIYSQGWNAAKKLVASGDGDVDAPRATACNPYRAAEERSRWTKGFMEALESPTKPSAAPGGMSRRVQAAKRILAAD